MMVPEHDLSMLQRKDRQRAHEAIDKTPNTLFTTTPSQQPILRMMTSFQFRFLSADNAPFLTLSPLDLSQIKLGQIDPLTFYPPNESSRFNNRL
jgi:hypothetical protein